MSAWVSDVYERGRSEGEGLGMNQQSIQQGTTAATAMFPLAHMRSHSTKGRKMVGVDARIHGFQGKYKAGRMEASLIKSAGTRVSQCGTVATDMVNSSMRRYENSAISLPASDTSTQKKNKNKAGDATIKQSSCINKH